MLAAKLSVCELAPKGYLIVHQLKPVQAAPHVHGPCVALSQLKRFAVQLVTLENTLA